MRPSPPKGPRLLGALLTLVAAAAVLPVVLLGLGPRTGAYQVRTILTGSMRPQMPPGSIVVMTPTPMYELEVGDVITYQIPNSADLVTHRILEIDRSPTGTVVRTKGDNNEDPDPWKARLGGTRAWKVRFAVPGVGYVMQALNRRAVAASLVLVFTVVVGLAAVAAIWARGRSEEQNGGGKGDEATEGRDRPVTADA